MTAHTSESQSPNPSSLSAEGAHEAIAGLMPNVKSWLTELVAFQSVHSVPELQEHNDNAARWVKEAFTKVGVPVEQIRTKDGSDSIIGLREPSEGMPTVLLYSHFDVQPATDVENWTNDPWELTERNGRWYGRGAADCKGNVVMHLAVLTALQKWESENPDAPKIGLRIVIEGSEERGGWGLEQLLEDRPELFAADAILIADSGNDEVGTPALCTALRGSAPIKVTLKTLEGPVHSGQFGGAAPDALLAMVKLINSLHDDNGLLTIDGLDNSGSWDGNQVSASSFRRDATVLDGVQLIGSEGTTDSTGPSISDLTVSRHALTVTALDAVPTKDAINAVPATCSAVFNLRVPPATDPVASQDVLIKHVENHVPWGAKLEIERISTGEPFKANVDSPLYEVLGGALSDAYGKELGFNASGGSIPLCAALLKAHPQAELALFGVEEPECRIHSADESVDPTEIENIAVGELLFLTRFGR